MITQCPSMELNFLSPNGFLFSVERLPTVSFFSQSISLPNLSLADIGQQTPLSRIAIPSDQLEFGPLVVPFIVDEQMKNYLEVFAWLRGLGFPEDYQQYTVEQMTRAHMSNEDLPRNYSDATLTILSSNFMPVKTFRFVDCFPTSLDGISFSSANTDVQYATSSVTFNYSYFKID